jgi:tetratricopeptide (TPR) repeat protein
MGKTRLLEELLSRVGDEATVVRGACRLYQAATPYFPFRSLLRQALSLEGLDEAATIAALETLVAERAPTLAPWLSLIATPLDVDIPPSKEVEQLDDRFRRARLEESVDALLAAVLDHPVIVLVEDTHWADDASRDLLAKLAGSANDRPWLLVLTRRPAGATLVQVDDATAIGIELQPLEVEQAAALIDAATVDRPLMPQQVKDLAGRAEGNPLFLIELLDALRRGEDVEALPRSVEGLIQARIDRLAPSDRTRLRELSVLGVGFLAEHAGAVLDDAGPRHVSRALRRLGDFLAVDRKGWVQFRHALIRDAAYEGLPFRARQRLHAQVGDSILAAAGDRPEDQAELLSVHYFHAGRWPEAWTYARIAGDRAREIYANAEAARFYERAVAASRRIERVDNREVAAAWISLGASRERAGLFEPAFKAFREATRLLVDDPVARAGAFEKRAVTRLRIGAYPLVLRETATGCRLLKPESSRAAALERARLVALRAEVRLLQGHPREAIDLATMALGEARTDETDAVIRSYLVLDGAYQMLGEPEKTVHTAKALEILERLGRLREAALAEMNLGVQAYADGQWDEAIRRYTRSQENSRRSGDEAQAAIAGANLGEVLVSRGALSEAEAILGEAIRVLRASRLTPYAVFAATQLARLTLARGETSKTLALFAQIVEEAAKLGHSGIALEVSLTYAAAQVEAGEPAAALATLAEAESGAGDEAALLSVPLARVRGMALTALGRLDEATAELTDALTGARRQGLVYEQFLVLQERARLAQLRGMPASAEEAQEVDRLLHLLGIESRVAA